jgi:CHASE2 domain-containing sensor protein
LRQVRSPQGARRTAVGAEANGVRYLFVPVTAKSERARIAAGLALIAWALTGWPVAAYAWLGWVGVVPIVTAFVGFCPAYTLLGMNTCGLPKKAT